MRIKHLPILRRIEAISPLLLGAAFLALARTHANPCTPTSSATPGISIISRNAANGVPITAVRYGTSVEGRPLVAYVLGDGDNVTLVTGGMHGNERSSPGVVERLNAYLIAHPREWTGCRVVIVVNVNPDGDAAGTRGNAHGVDLNRNFPYHWAARRPGVALSSGSGPLSEPEARGLVRLLDAYHPAKSISVHQPLNELVGVGEGGTALAYAMRPGNGYRETADVGYPTPGSFGMYLWHVRHIAGVTLEMPWTSPESGWEKNRAALMTGIRYVVAK